MLQSVTLLYNSERRKQHDRPADDILVPSLLCEDASCMHLCCCYKHTIIFPHVLAPSTNASDVTTTNLMFHHNGQLLQGPYVLVMVATGQHQKSNKLPAMWLISAYRSLSRPFRKNVRYILLVRPTGGLKALVACIRPFVSAKAARKVRKVRCGAVHPWKHASGIQSIKEAVGQMMGIDTLPCLSFLLLFFV